jgi:hypothetical protein
MVAVTLDDMPTMDGNEFRDLGFLQEVNRIVLHPCGLALAVDPDDGTLSVLVDADPEGWMFALANAPESERRRFVDNACRVADATADRAEARRAVNGSVIQPIRDALTRRRRG